MKRVSEENVSLCLIVNGSTIYFLDTENELTTALDIQSKLYENEKALEEKDRMFNAKMYELEQEKERVLTEHERFKCQHAEENQRLSKTYLDIKQRSS